MNTPHITIYKTSVEEKEQADSVLSVLYDYFPYCRISLDHEDCDHVLRVESRDIQINEPMLRSLVTVSGYSIEVLQD